MSRQLLRIAGCTVLLLPFAVGTSHAANPPALLPGSQIAQPRNVRPVQFQAQPPMPVAAPAAASQPGFVYLNAPLYPVPRPDVPIQMGATLLTNQAFHPQEMLYPHDYVAMYPPYYYRAKGGWVVTPWGVRNKETWELQGTKVKVKYRSHAPFWSGITNGNTDYFLWDQNWSNNPPMSRRHR
ncbi:hypothetical protein [Stratiformator vulcanicus]|uniref:YXWGXW repeat-containing protein n=1 Tax=Stratiformator vulcanicus TaxID=2527980 RepID=A0A517R6X6_9PLAN|nr:hypothetical protein [Stratiformator vulcanicus]QDT39615.1 hypothetical protein Pan189_40240 [Stratiformator vulcanicus]